MNHFPTPSEMMRAKRPYLYSDSERTDAYRLSESEFRNHLDTLTNRNQHKDFENFARKLAERTICPNLRPQTGPEGGGDGKVDTETFPVDDDLADRWYIASARSGEEEWGFAFSAKKDWKPKAAKDVEGIVGTGRHYDRVIVITSRPARQADRLALQQSLSETHQIKVTILDQEWIVDQVFGNGYKDLAYEYLKAGEHEPDKLKIGPNDIARQQSLDAIEATIATLGTSESDRTQLVASSFEAARLSRELERPRVETDGRFERAIRVASKHGSTSQHLRAVYEHGWTAVWWYDDIDAMLEHYDEVETIAFPTDIAEHISKVCNLHQILVAQVIQKHASPEDRDLAAKTERLRQKLLELSQDKRRPNNALHAEALSALLTLNEGTIRDAVPDWDTLWRTTSSIISRAEGLGEFPAEMIDLVIDALSEFAPDSEAFDQLVEQLAEFMAERSKELKAGEMYLTQGERKLEREKPIEGIKWLGRAVVNLAKAESREQQAEALYLLSVGYRGAGLLWAARSTALASAIQYAALSDVEGDLRIELVPALKLLRIVSLQLGHLTDALAAHQFLFAVCTKMPLDDESRGRVVDGNVEFDHLLACLLTVQLGSEIARLSRLPDVLEHLGLPGSRIMLLHRLGHAEVLRSDGSVPPQTDNDELDAMLVAAAAQPASADLPNSLVLFDDQFSSVRTKVLGVDVEVSSESSRDGLLQAESYAAALEGFAATMLNIRIFPHVQRFAVVSSRSEDLSEGVVKEGKGNSIETSVPAHWSMTEPVNLREFNTHLIHTTIETIMGMAAFDNPVETLDELVEKEQVLDRALAFCHAGISRQRLLGAPVGQICDWDHWVKRTYPLKEDAPKAPAAKQSSKGGRASEKPASKADMPTDETHVAEEMQSHSDLAVRSVIDKKLWDAAHWQGFAYSMILAPNSLPVLGIMFEDEAASDAIFDDWLMRFGEVDEQDEIRIAVLKGIDKAHPTHYRAHITQSLDNLAADGVKRFINLSRTTTMTVESHVNLENFLQHLSTSGCYLIAPAVVVEIGQPELKLDRAILKRKFVCRSAWEVGPHDIDAMGVTPDDDVVIPNGVVDPPVADLQRWRERTNRGPRSTDSEPR